MKVVASSFVCGIATLNVAWRAEISTGTLKFMQFLTGAEAFVAGTEVFLAAAETARTERAVRVVNCIVAVRSKYRIRNDS